MSRLIPVLNQPNWEVDLLENVAITLGRLGLVCPDPLAAALPLFSRVSIHSQHFELICLALFNLQYTLATYYRVVLAGATLDTRWTRSNFTNIATDNNRTQTDSPEQPIEIFLLKG